MFKQIRDILFSKSKVKRSLDTTLDAFDQKIYNLDSLIYPNEAADPRATFDRGLPVEQHSMASLTLNQTLQFAPTMFHTQRHSARSGRYYERSFVPTQHEVSPAFIEELEALAYRLGASDIKYVQIPGDSIFQGKGIPYKNAIGFTVNMDQANIETDPSFEAFHKVIDGYRALGRISNALTDLLRANGFAAYPGQSVGGLTDYVRIAELAGLGIIDYHGLLISPHDGARLRINVVYTNITNLPIVQENPHAWVHDFCAMCRKCVRKCPAEAIYQQPQEEESGHVQCIDSKKCLDYFTMNYGCAVCVAVCPFSHTSYEQIKQRFKGHPNAPKYMIPLEAAHPSIG